MAALPAEEGRSKTLIWCFYIKGVGDYDDWVTFFLVASSIASADYSYNFTLITNSVVHMHVYYVLNKKQLV